MSSALKLVHEQNQLQEQLLRSVDPRLDKLWSDQIKLGGIVPAEIMNDPEKMATFPASMIRFGEFVGKVVKTAWELNHKNLTGKQIHYVGVGSGHDLREVTLAGQEKGMVVVAYDTSTSGHENALDVFEEVGIKYPLTHSSYMADVEAVCNRKILDPKLARYICFVRVLEALNKPSEDPFKMERVCMLIGETMSYLKVIVVGARPEDNVGVKFNNTVPEPLSNIITPMEGGYNGSIKATELGVLSYYDHVYRAHLLEGMKD